MRQSMFPLWLGVLALIGCAQERDTVPEDALNFARFATGGPSFDSLRSSVYAVRGEARELRLTFADGSEFARLELSAEALLRRPDGSEIGHGDSVQITVTLDSERLAMTLEPTGLTFNPQAPAQLTLSYSQADDDFNGNGEVDAEDREIKSRRLALWRQARRGEAWSRVATTHDVAAETFRARLEAFSGYGVAW